MTASAATASKVKVQFETSQCHRCFGAGYFQEFGHVVGGRCFKCGGSGKVHTRRGANAHRRFTERITEATHIPAIDIQVGMGVQVYASEKFRTVESVEIVPTARRTLNGEPDGINDVRVRFIRCATTYQLPATMMVRRTSTVEEWNAVADSVRHLQGVTITE